MKLSENAIQALNLEEFDIKLWNTPFRYMDKEQKVYAIALGDRVSSYYFAQKDEARKNEVVIPYYEQPENVQSSPKRFY